MEPAREIRRARIFMVIGGAMCALGFTSSSAFIGVGALFLLVGVVKLARVKRELNQTGKE